MTDHRAKKLLRKLLRSFSGGKLLHLLAQLYAEEARDARREAKEHLSEQFTCIEAALIVAGHGLNATCRE